MKLEAICALTLLTLTACTPAKRSPDAIRDDTARVTSEAARDAKAVAQGVAQGLKEKGPVNINKASESDLKDLPGIDDAAAKRIVAGRPYEDSIDLQKRHVVTKAEYDRIAAKITAD